MTDSYHPEDASEAGGLDVLDVLRRIWSGWFTVGAYAAIGLLLAICYLHLATYTYRAKLVLVPTEGQNVNITGQLGHLASLAGVNINQGQSVAPFVLFPVTIVTRDVANDLATRRPDLMHEIFKDQWDSRAHRWVAPSGFVRGLVRLVKAILGIPNLPWHPPTGTELQSYISDKLNVDQDTKLPVLTLSFDSKNPKFATQMLLGLDESTDRILRKITLQRSTKYAAYLEMKLKTERQTDLRKVLIDSLSQQETQLMMSSSDTPFAAQPLGPPERSPKAVSPVPVLVLLFGIILGGLVGCAAAFFGIGTIRPPFLSRFIRRDRHSSLYGDT